MDVSTALATLKTEFEAASASAFEVLAAHLFSRLIGDIGVSVSKPGSQFGGDAGTAGLGGRRLRLECKRYRESTVLSPRSLAGEVLEAVQKDPLIEAWILAATKEVSETERNLARDAGATLGVAIVAIDWTPPAAGAGINALASLCATWPQVVEDNIGKAAADAARALVSHVGTGTDNLRRDFQVWNIGFKNLRTCSLTQVQRVWLDSVESQAALNQNAAGGGPGVHLIERKEPLAQLHNWWLAPPDVRAAAILSGLEGVGKTWVALDWVNRDQALLPIVILLPASTFVGSKNFSDAGIRDLLAAHLRSITKSSLDIEYWRARVDRLLNRPVAEGSAFLLLVDGINQQPSVAWKTLVQTLQGVSLAGRIRLVCTSRQHYFAERLRRFLPIDIKPNEMQVGPYSAVELEELLKLHGIGSADIPPKLLTLASTPRLFPLVVRLKDSDALKSEATVLRLLFEYGKDVLQLRDHSTLTDDDWVQWLTERAKAYRTRLAAAGATPAALTVNQLAATVTTPQISEEEVARRLSDILDGGFFRPQSSATGTRHVLMEEPTILGLGLALLDSLEGATDSFEGLQGQALKWLEPLAAIDQVADVVGAALAVLSALGGLDANAKTDALLVLWMNAQNPPASFQNDALAFGDAFPKSMLTVIEQSTLSSKNAAFHYGVQSLRRLPRIRTDDWSAVLVRMLVWTSWVELPHPDKVADPQHYAQRHQEQLKARIGSVLPGHVQVLGEDLKFDYSHAGDPSVAIPGILEGHELAFFMPVFRRAAVREAVRVDHSGRCLDGLRWVVLLACQKPQDARACLERLAEDVLLISPEPGIDVRLRNRTAACLLRLTGIEKLERRAAEVNETYGLSWDYQRDYFNDPVDSLFALEHRHVDAILAATTKPVGRRLDRLAAFVADPDIVLPADLLHPITDALAKQTFDRIDEIGQRTIEEINIERLMPLGARFAPKQFAEMTRRRLSTLAGRDGDKKYWAANAAPEMVLTTDESIAAQFTGLRTGSAHPDDELANAWCLQLELLHMPLGAQLLTLLEARHFCFLDNLMAVVRKASADELSIFLSNNDHDRARAATVVMQVMAFQHTSSADVLGAELAIYLDAEDKELRAVAFVALAVCCPHVAGRALVAGDWKAESDDAFEAHHGSSCVMAATSHLAFDDVLALIAPWRWLDAAVARGGVPAELGTASTRLLALLSAPGGTLPDFEGVLSVRIPDGGELSGISVKERDKGKRNITEALHHAARSPEEFANAMQQLTQNAAATIQKIRRTGNGLYLHTFSFSAVEAAYMVSASTWDQLLEGADHRTTEFSSRVSASEGLHLCFCAVLFKHAPTKGLRLWRALVESMRVRFDGLAKIPELVHIAFRSAESPEALQARADLTALVHCNTDQDVLELVVAAQLHTCIPWVNALIEDDAASDELWHGKRAIVLKAFLQCPQVNEMRWHEGMVVGSWNALRERMLEWTNRGGLAKHWWNRFLSASDADAAYAAWHVFLTCADRRASLWIQDMPEPNSELDRLRSIHLELNRDALSRVIKKREETAPKLGDHLFGLESPANWLTLDGAKYG